jgi:predicted AAA+ superfamily ATPase
MGQIIPRSIFPLLESSLQESRITAILGARQVGKSTLARSLPNPYYSLDDLGTRAFATRDPVGFAQSLPAGAIIDEIQRVPDLLLALKSIVDLEQSTHLGWTDAYSGIAPARRRGYPEILRRSVGASRDDWFADNEQLLTKNHNLLGNLLETFVVNEIRKQASWSVIRPRLYHLRLYDGREIDLILQARDGRSVAIEIKATASQSSRDARTLCEVVNNPKSPMLRGVFLSTGERTVPIGERVLALPIEALWRSGERE